jgi:UDP-N-acetylmuramyl pentapeptide phosphotransferase/UDP-N-acetylglucosamine-1-phosphate transferase
MVPASELVMVPKLPESTALLMMVVLVVVKVHANSVFVMVLASVMAIAQRLRNDNASRRAHNRHLHPMVSRGGLQR